MIGAGPIERTVNPLDAVGQGRTDVRRGLLDGLFTQGRAETSFGFIGPVLLGGEERGRSDAREGLGGVENTLQFAVQPVSELLDDTARHSAPFPGRGRPYWAADGQGDPSRAGPFGALGHSLFTAPDA